MLSTIPAGEYLIGDDSNPVSRPAHTVRLAGFSISRTAVTNRQFVRFIDSNGYGDESLWTAMGWRWLRGKPTTEPAFWRDPLFNALDQPVVGVCWYEAVAYASLKRRETGQNWRLLTEAEWEAAAGRELPADTTKVNSAELGIRRPPWQAEGIGAQSWCGAWNLCGNVWEWTSSRWGRNWQTLDYAYPYNAADGREDLGGSPARVMRGGSYFDVLKEAHPSNRGRFLPGSRASNISFRLGMDG